MVESPQLSFFVLVQRINPYWSDLQ
jgi:hypothetical protein